MKFLASYNETTFLLSIQIQKIVVSIRSFSLTWPAAMQIYWNKRKFLHKKRV